jgi:hypothetical protein
MNVEFTLEKEDFLTFQLYTASKSETVIKTRNKYRIRVPIAYAILSIILYEFADIIFAGIFLCVGLLWYLLYPYYIRKKYVKHYSKHIDEQYKNRFGKSESLTIKSDVIESKDIIGESKINMREIEELNEIKDYYFIKFSSGVSLIIPKNRIKKSEELKEKLQNIVSDLSIKHNQELDWKWH